MRSSKIFMDKSSLWTFWLINDMLKNLVKSCFCCNKPYVSHPVEKKIPNSCPPFSFIQYLSLCVWNHVCMCVVAIWGLCLLLVYWNRVSIECWAHQLTAVFSREFLVSVSLCTVLDVCVITLSLYMDAEFLYSNTLSILIPLASLAVKL